MWQAVRQVIADPTSTEPSRLDSTVRELSEEEAWDLVQRSPAKMPRNRVWIEWENRSAESYAVTVLAAGAENPAYETGGTLQGRRRCPQVDDALEYWWSRSINVIVDLGRHYLPT